MSGRPKYPDNLSDVIWRLMNDGHGTTAITRILEEGEPEIGRPLPMSVRTVARRIRDIREERGEPLQHVPEGQVTATLGALERATIATCRTEIARLQAKQRTGPLSPTDLTMLERLAKTIRQLKAPAGATRTSQRGQREPDSPSSPLDQIDLAEAVLSDLTPSEGEAEESDSLRGARQESHEARSDEAARSLEKASEVSSQGDLIHA